MLHPSIRQRCGQVSTAKIRTKNLHHFFPTFENGLWDRSKEREQIKAALPPK